MAPPQTLIPTAQVAEAIGVTPSAVARMVKAGRLTPAAKAPGLRGCMFFERGDVERLKAEGSSC